MKPLPMIGFIPRHFALQRWVLAAWLMLAALSFGQAASVSLPPGISAVWDWDKAYRETTPSRERVCINGLWQWQPATGTSDVPPANNWGYFKVPGCWPGITDYMQKDCQTVWPHPAWKQERMANVTAAWYQRTITVPQSWNGRRVTLSVEYLNSYATAFLDGNPCGEIRFPGGELDLTAHIRPGTTQLLSLHVLALPLKGVILSYTDSNAARETKGRVERRGLCGDVFLASTPPEARIANLKIETSVRKGQIAFDAALEGLPGNDNSYTLQFRVTKGGQAVRDFTSAPFRARDLKAGHASFTAVWLPELLWDLHTPTNQFEATVSLVDSQAATVDTCYRKLFGFREFWIEGRDFYLNGSRIFLCAVPLDNAQVGAALASYEGARETFQRLKAIGVNFVYTHNYSCEPGTHLGFDEILRAADDVGLLVSLTQPHFSHYEWKSPDAERTNGYPRHALFYAEAAGNHPSVVAYAMSHNATGYEEDMNPDLIDGLHDPRDTWSRNNSRLALRAQAVVSQLDPSRIVYHHASGNLGSMHCVNFYPNFAPIQELSDWFEHWSVKGVKPVFTCEYGAPFTWDWTMYRGWYKGVRNFGSAEVPWEFCLAEWNAQFLGDAAFRISTMEAANLRWEARQFRAGRLWHRWDYPYVVGSPALREQDPVFAMYTRDNWRAFRTWEVSAISPWEYGRLWHLRDGVDRSRKDMPVDWEHLQRPGFSADYIDQRYERMDTAFDAKDWIPGDGAIELIRNNQPLLAYIAGKSARFTSKDHLFLPGDSVEKQLIVINNSRQGVICQAEWTLALPKPIRGETEFPVNTGEQVRFPLHFNLPVDVAAKEYSLTARFHFANGGTQTDSFVIHVLNPPEATATASSMTAPLRALFDPRGETRALLKELGVRFESVDSGTDLSGFSTLIIGKLALTTNGPAPDIAAVRNGLKVIVFEQRADVLERRFGFRVAEYGLRQVFPRVMDHSALRDLPADAWRDWRGASTVVPPRLEYTSRARFGPTVSWCDIPVPRLWRCGNQGNVASVLIEKPACGDFLPLVDGGYSLQYSPLLEYGEGQGMVLFCQLDVTARTEAEPAAGILARNLLRYVDGWKPKANAPALYAGEPEGLHHLQTAGASVTSYDRAKLAAAHILILGPGSGRALQADRESILAWLQRGGRLIGFGLDDSDLAAVLPMKVSLTSAEHISTFFDPTGMESVFRGIGPADMHNRDPQKLPLVQSGLATHGNGVLAASANGRIALCQLVPWHFDPAKQSNLKRTFRRSSVAAARLIANMGVASSTPLLARLHASPAKAENRWLTGLYLDQPEEWDDPYRHFRW